MVVLSERERREHMKKKGGCGKVVVGCRREINCEMRRV